MSLVLRKFFDATVVFALLLLFTIPTFAQRSLHDAMDYDGDNRADLAVFRQTNALWYILRSTQSSTTGTQFGIATTDEPCPGDYDGDGRGDICVWRSTNGTFYYLRSSDGSFGSQQWGIENDEPVARNWDGDGGGTANGRTDFAVARRTNGQIIWYTLTNPPNGQTPTVTAFQFGLASDTVITGDYNGDGRFDYGVQRANSSGSNAPTTIYTQESGPNGVFRQQQFGLSNDIIAPGDYDGDNRTDLCAVRNVGGALVWYVLRSSDGVLTSTQFGASDSDFLVQNDYDGDGRTDIAVWRDTNGFFFVQGSLGAFQATQFGASSIDFPIAAYDTH